MELLITHCSAAFSEQRNLFIVFFLGGLTGSLTHCLTMCGPLVCCQAACSRSCSKTLSAFSPWQYHTGRFIAYGALGFFTSLTAKHLSAYSFWPHISFAMLAFAGILFVASGIYPSHSQWISLSYKHSFIRGILMSFMPCGLLYAALMITATIPTPLIGMIAMWCFVLGTMPVLLLITGSTNILAQKWQQTMNRIGRVGLTFNGLTIIAMAAKLAR